jgi:hypothetical protein
MGTRLPCPRPQAAYRPSPVEAAIIKHLGVTQYQVMMVAVQTPALSCYRCAPAARGPASVPLHQGSARGPRALGTHHDHTPPPQPPPPPPPHPARSVPQQVEPSIKALKAANLDPGDIWFIISKCHHLLAEPLPLQRWLDFLAAYKLTTRDVVQFLQRAPRNLFADATLHQASRVRARPASCCAPAAGLPAGGGPPRGRSAPPLRLPTPAPHHTPHHTHTHPTHPHHTPNTHNQHTTNTHTQHTHPTHTQHTHTPHKPNTHHRHHRPQVVSFLKSLSIKDEVIGARVLCLRPELLLRDVEAQLQPLATQLLNLGLEARDIGHMVAVRRPPAPAPARPHL